LYLLPGSKEFVAARLDLSSWQRPDMFTMFLFTETISASLLQCSSSRHKLPPSFTAFMWLTTCNQVTHDDEQRNNLDELD